jgi:hypothetical protein
MNEEEGIKLRGWVGWFLHFIHIKSNGWLDPERCVDVILHKRKISDADGISNENFTIRTLERTRRRKRAQT